MMPRSPGLAENAVDVRVARQFFADENGGTMLEVGAARPDWLSIGAYYRARGWDVLSVEPNPHFVSMHRALGHSVVECACSNQEAVSAPFYVVDSADTVYRDGNVSYESWSSLGLRGEFQAMGGHSTRRAISVPVKRADTILAEHRPEWSGIDLVAIDIEGWELEALSGLDFARYTPKVLIVENLLLSCSYRAFMREQGYVLWRCFRPNEVYVRADLLRNGARVAAGAQVAVATTVGRSRALAGMVKRRMVARLRVWK